MRGRPRKSLAYISALRNVGTPPGSKPWEKPELTGEDARTELSAVEIRGAELTGGVARMEMDVTPAEHRFKHELDA